MHEKIFLNPAIEAKHRRRLLGAHLDCFVTWMQEHGYSPLSIQFYIQYVTHFGKYLERRGVCSIHQLEGLAGQKLLATYQRYCKRRGYSRRDSGLKLYLQALEEASVLTKSVSTNSLTFHETEQYVSFLKNQKGLSKGTISYHIHWVEKFLRFIGCQKGASCLPTFGISDIDKFVSQEGVRLQRSTQHSLAGVLRSFLRFLYQSGKLTTDLSCFVTSSRCYKLESLPCVLHWDEVQKILGSVDRSTRTGSQHYAILVFLATYGLRAGEVANLKLEDIDWKKETIRIASRKMGKDLWLPLTPQVSEAILEYLKSGRHSSKYRQVFLLTRAPWIPLDRRNIAYVVNRYVQLAGLNPARHGPHLFRHSFATHLIRAGVPLKQIGDMLGHQASESTHIYTKTATEHLREVALEVPEVR